MMKEIIEYYHNNQTFKDFVDANARTYDKDVSFILATPTTIEYYKSMQKGGCNEHHINNI